MSEFSKKYGNLSVREALALNEAARWYCEHDIVANCDGGGND